MTDAIADRPGPGNHHQVASVGSDSAVAGGGAPPVRVEPDARHRIHREVVRAGRRIAVLDDDPTGSQTVHDVNAPTGHPAGHGLVVVGSHVGLSSRQVAVAQEHGGVAEVELEVAAIADSPRRAGHIAGVTRRVVSAPGRSDVLLFTSRRLLRDEDPAASLEIARQLSTAVTEVVRGALSAKPTWVIAKGGITSHDVSVRSLGIRRATVLGQLLPGQVTVLRPIEAAPEAVGTPYVVFAGSVGDENTLAYVIDLFRGKP
jgi:uncharacterized protein YgbK (DUF1537 family)